MAYRSRRAPDGADTISSHPAIYELIDCVEGDGLGRVSRVWPEALGDGGLTGAGADAGEPV
jgi:hypothetical protein